MNRSSSTYQFERRVPFNISSNLRLVKRFEGKEKTLTNRFDVNLFLWFRIEYVKTLATIS